MSLKSAIDQLYCVFQNYSIDGMYYCQCGCISKEDVNKLTSKPLQNLTKELVSYQGSAIYTWGSINHYKFYLPRLLELSSITSPSKLFELEEIFNRLQYANWKNWESDEIAAIENFVLEEWKVLNSDSKFRQHLNKVPQFQLFFTWSRLLQAWELREGSISIKNFVSFFYRNGSKLFDKEIANYNQKERKQFFQTLVEKNLLAILENEFFNVDSTNNNYEQQISYTIKLIEYEMNHI